MEEHQDPSPEYIIGFNQMYMLKQNMPELANQMLSAQGKSDRLNGMKAGAKQFELERVRQTSQKGRDQTHERDC